MKAWLVRERGEFCAAVVFAETRGKARALALHTDACEDAKFTDIEVSRMEVADKYYKEGKCELDWNNDEDRIALVKDCGFRCDPDWFEWEDCLECTGRQHCDVYQDHLQEEQEG